MNKILEVENLVKKYGKVLALDNISFSLEKGEILGIIGPNGAGKSTLMKIIATMLSPTQGKVFVFGKNVVKDKRKVREKVSLVSDYTVLEDELTPYENLKIFGMISGYNGDELEKKINNLLSDFELIPYKNRLTKNLSSGNRQKLNIARALIKDPELLLLDEPTLALDVETSRFIREYIKRENVTHQKTVLLISHYMWEIETLSTKILFIIDGKIEFFGTLEELKKKFLRNYNVFRIKRENLKDSEIKELQEKGVLVDYTFANDDSIICFFKKEYDLPEKIKSNFESYNPTLEDIYTVVIKKYGYYETG